MTTSTASIAPQGLARIFAWRRVRVALITITVFFVLMLPGWAGSYPVLIGRLLFVGMIQLLVFGLLEHWPRRLPNWLARWALQVAGIAMVIPFAVAIAYELTTLHQPESWMRTRPSLGGFAQITLMGLLVTPWIAMSALYRQVSGQAQRQALQFELERSELERQATDARLKLLQAQVEPHFLFNTLANVRELVESGSPQAAELLGSLIAYLRAAVPRLHDGGATVGQEVELARAYLEVMHMRMPDRLQFMLHADDDTLRLACPPMSLLTLVENAVRHGIDPAEEGGRIELRVQRHGDRCRAQVIDTGVGLQSGVGGLGTGLATLRERLQLAFAGDATLRLLPLQPHGVCAEVEFPAREVAA
jgi:signal transduction histidine kinase